jgi:hypothetical protein
MSTRRLVACACALALAVPAAASARVATDAPAPTDKKANVYVAPAVDTVEPKGDTKNDIAPAISKRHPVVVPAGKTAGKVVVVNPQHHTAPVAGSADDGTDGWKIAAVAGAGLLAAIAMGGAVAVAGQMRPRRRVTTA